MKLARHIKENESSSWATPRAGNPGSRPNGKGGKVLAEQAQQNWPTARTSDAEGGRIETEITPDGFKSKRHKSNQTFGAKLRDAVETYEENWATPIANDAKGSDYAGTKENPKALYLGGQVKKEESWPTPTAVNRVRDEETMEKCLKFRQSNGQTSVPLYLEETVLKEEKKEKNWMSPTVMDSADIKGERKKSSGGQHPPLSQQVKGYTRPKEEKSWPTPAARDHKGANSPKHCEENPRHNTQLPNAVMLNDLKEDKNWPTPTARDHKGSYSPEAMTRKDGKSRMDALPQVVEYDHTSWPTPTVAEGGKIGCQPNYGQKGLSNHPAIVGHPDRNKLNKSGKSQESWATPKASTGNHPDYQSERERKTPDLESNVRIKMGYPPLKSATQKGRLNPDWVEQLMGLPVGWTQIG